MAGWQDKVSVDERRTAALLAALVNARQPLPTTDVLSQVPEYSSDRSDALIELGSDVDLLRSYGLDILWGGPGSPDVAIGVKSWQHRPADLNDTDRRLLDQAVAFAGPLGDTAAAALAAVHGEPLPPEGDTTISLSPRGSAARGRPVAYSRLHRLVWLAERGVTAAFGYPDPSGTYRPRLLQVAGLGESRGVWYAVGYEPGSGTMRAFAVSEMRGPVTEADAVGSYMLPPGLDVSEYLALSWRLGPDPQPARVRFDAHLAMYASSMLTHVPLEQQPDGSLDAVVTVGDVEDFVAWALSFGTHALILEPPAAVERAREMLAEVVARHG